MKLQCNLFATQTQVSTCVVVQVEHIKHFLNFVSSFCVFIFSYSDGDLTLIYPDGAKCSTGFQRMTIINFECSQNACEADDFQFFQSSDPVLLFVFTLAPSNGQIKNDTQLFYTSDSRFVSFSAANGGRGSPVFSGETDCTYYFSWETAFACVKEKEDLLCRVRDEHKHYDLSPLTRYPGESLSDLNKMYYLFNCELLSRISQALLSLICFGSVAIFTP